MAIPLTAFGSSEAQVTRVGLGGEGVLRSQGQEAGAQAVIAAANALGITYFDSAVAYAGSQGYLGKYWAENPGQRARVFQTSKSARRSKEGALADLDASLKTLACGYLDLWQIHDLRTEEDFAAIAGPGGGALEAFVAAKAAGKVRHIGVTGHHDPYLLTKAVMLWPLDSVLLPVNPVEAVLGGFLDHTLPAAREKGIAAIAMKVLGAGHYLSPQAGIGASELIRFALSQGPDLAIVGCATPQEVDQLAQAGEAGPLEPEACQRLKELYAPQAKSLAFYRGKF